MLGKSETCEVQGFAGMRCLKPNGMFCLDGWITVVVNIDLKRPTNDPQGNSDLAELEEQRVEANVCNSAEHTINIPTVPPNTASPSSRGSEESKFQSSYMLEDPPSVSRA